MLYFFQLKSKKSCTVHSKKPLQKFFFNFRKLADPSTVTFLVDHCMSTKNVLYMYCTPYTVHYKGKHSCKNGSENHRDGWKNRGIPTKDLPDTFPKFTKLWVTVVFSMKYSMYLRTHLRFEWLHVWCVMCDIEVSPSFDVTNLALTVM